jgi:hypothetical protein
LIRIAKKSCWFTPQIVRFFATQTTCREPCLAARFAEGKSGGQTTECGSLKSSGKPNDPQGKPAGFGKTISDLTGDQREVSVVARFIRPGIVGLDKSKIYSSEFPSIIRMSSIPTRSNKNSG